jgi:hypothetical protein
MSNLEKIKDPGNGKYSASFINIQNYWYDTTGKIKLTDSEHRMLERWSFADSQIRMEWVDEALVPKLLMLKFPEIKRTTAYEDIRNAKRLFGTKRIEDQMYYSDVHYSYALKAFKDSLKKNNHSAAARFLKLMNEIKTKNGDGVLEEQMQELADTLRNSKFIFIVDDPKKVGLQSFDRDYITALEKELMVDKNQKDKGEFTEYEEVK